MEKIKLNENWRMRCLNNGRISSEWQNAVVPGSVYTDLLRNHQIQDPYWKDNEDSVCALMEEEYEYECTFMNYGTDGYTDIYLEFEGLDTVADIYLNDGYVGHAENMHRIWKYDVKSILRKGENQLRIIFRSPLKYIAEAYKKYGNIGNDDTFEGFMHLRKAHYMFGWDWGAHLPDAGIFRPVWLCKETGGRIESVYICQNHEEGRCTLEFKGEYVLTQPGNYRTLVTLKSPCGEIMETELDADGDGRIVIDHPLLWWVNGLGEQPLYEVEAVLMLEEKTVDTWKRRIGLRSMTVRREKDEWGESFAHEINGVAFFAMGGDYIPEEHLLGRRSEEKTRQLLLDCKRANFNVIRVWGGGFYPDEWFYDICDELGLAVWQDFMFACAMYPGDPEFLENVKQEAVDNVIRLRNHPCIALWCGNNEIDAAWRGWGWKREYTQQQQERIFKAYTDVFHRLLPEVIEKYTDGDDYWPSSPMSGPEIGDHEIRPANRGDNHYWGVWHEKHKFEEYEKNIGRFISEHGFQSFPEFETVRQYTLPEDYDIESEIMSAHQRSGIGNLRIREYMGWYYQVPEDFGQMLYMSQVLQARAMRIAMETHRRHMPYCMGSLVWQLNDCWPVASWSSMDYYGRYKALHYMARVFNEAVAGSIRKEGNTMGFWISNESLKEAAVEVKVSLKDLDFKVLYEETVSGTVAPLSAVDLLTKDFSELIESRSEQVFVTMEYKVTDKETGKTEERCEFETFVPVKHLELKDPELTVSCAEDGTVTISAKSFAPYCMVEGVNEDIIWDSNVLAMTDGNAKVLHPVKGVVPGVKPEIRVYDVYHTYA